MKHAPSTLAPQTANSFCNSPVLPADGGVAPPRHADKHDSSSRLALGADPSPTYRTNFGSAALVLLAFGLWLGLGCEEELDPPKIQHLPNAISMPVRAVGYPWYEDIQFANVGQGTLEIEELSLYGDPNCGFRFEVEGSRELLAGQALLVRAWFDPPAPGDYTVALVVQSNSEENSTIEIPICGRAVAQGTTEEVDPIPIEECTAPASSDPVCTENPITESAP